MLARAEIGMETPSRYLGQLCKHFAHRLPVTQEAAEGSITFPFGTCRLHASADALVMEAEAADEATLAQLRDVLDRHLLRFAFRQPPTIVWQPVTG